ncbi:PTS sugar transporter subunit IIA [Erysipelothrix urinaevulpis]|uniref:PTS sugar transporter subunit IIA n=1 Tax=Erysipelothrix urinaevulpis TaxID=2683717 RepID=UPI001359312B|nr:PTS sugar transporter subunit IIA [Erysipelothrix urinaevulpis]
MVGILLISHGEMAQGIKSALQLISGDVDSIEISSLHAGQDFEDLKADVNKKIKKINQGQGVLVYVDLFGASPYNAAMFAHEVLKNEEVAIRVITGMNLPMILESTLMRESMSLDELAKLAIKTGKESIVEGIEFMTNLDQEEEEEDY